jgi:hypothetical protein
MQGWWDTNHGQFRPRRGEEDCHARDVGYVALHALMLSEGVQYGQTRWKVQ